MSELTIHERGYLGMPTIVFLHGVGNTGAMWRDLMGALPDYQCLAPDMPGHGGSRVMRWRSRADTAERVAALIERRATGARAHVVGLSLGGSIAIELLATRPELLDHVVVDGCAALPSVVTGPMKLVVSAISPFLRFPAVARLIGRTFGIKPGAALEDFVAQIQAVDPRSFRRAFAEANETRLTLELLTASCPTLFVAGERELRHVRASNRLLAERMPCATARFVPGAGHGWGASQDPELHRRMVTAWIDDRPLPDGLVAEPSADADRRPVRRAQGTAEEASR